MGQDLSTTPACDAKCKEVQGECDHVVKLKRELQNAKSTTDNNKDHKCSDESTGADSLTTSVDYSLDDLTDSTIGCESSTSDFCPTQTAKSKKLNSECVSKSEDFPNDDASVIGIKGIRHNHSLNDLHTDYNPSKWIEVFNKIRTAKLMSTSRSSTPNSSEFSTETDSLLGSGSNPKNPESASMDDSINSDSINYKPELLSPEESALIAEIPDDFLRYSLVKEYSKLMDNNEVNDVSKWKDIYQKILKSQTSRDNVYFSSTPIPNSDPSEDDNNKSGGHEELSDSTMKPDSYSDSTSTPTKTKRIDSGYPDNNYTGKDGYMDNDSIQSDLDNSFRKSSGNNSILQLDLDMSFRKSSGKGSSIQSDLDRSFRKSSEYPDTPDKMSVETADRASTSDESIGRHDSLDDVFLLDELAAGHMTHEQLQHHVGEQHQAMTRMQTHAHAQQVKANLVVTSLRAKMRRKEQELQAARTSHDKMVTAVVSRLLFLEGRMQKDQAEVTEALQERDDVIRRQRAALDDLSEKNSRLLAALQESHGYVAPDNGLHKSPEHVVQNGNISIQDHGNKVILRKGKGRDSQGQAKEKSSSSGHKVRFNFKDKLRRHNSSLELYQSEKLDTVFEDKLRYYGSEDNLLDENVEMREEMNNSRDAKCRSMVDFPREVYAEDDDESRFSYDSCFDECSSPGSSLSRSASITSSTSAIYNNGSSRESYGMASPSSVASSPSFSSSTSSLVSPSATKPPKTLAGFSELSKSRSVPHALPTVIENDATHVTSHLKERPHSVPIADLLTQDSPSGKVNMSPHAGSNYGGHPPSSPPAESNIKSSFKNIFRRKGSKKKQRSVSLGQGTNQEYQEAITQHFKKYNLT